MAIKKTFQNNQNSFENKLDKLIQQSQYGETHGLPTGSLAIKIIAELYMCHFDKKMYQHGFIYSRYVDDFLYAFNNEKDKDTFIEKFNLICREHNLHMNKDKTTVESFPYNNKNDKTEMFNYFEKHNLFNTNSNNDKKRKIVKDYVDFCMHQENLGNKGSLKVLFTGIDIAFSKIMSDDEISSILLDSDPLSNFNLLEYLIDITLKKADLSNRLLGIIDKHISSPKTSIVKQIFSEYINRNEVKIVERMRYYHENKFNLELCQLLTYLVLFGDNNQALLSQVDILNMYKQEVDDYSLCLLTIIYLQNDYDYFLLLKMINELLTETHSFYKNDNARFTEKFWFFRYFVYYILFDVAKLQKISNSYFSHTELDWSYIKTQNTKKQKAVNDFYEQLLKNKVALVNCGNGFKY